MALERYVSSEEIGTQEELSEDQKKPEKAGVLWHGKPSIGSYVMIFGLGAIVAIVILVTLEYFASRSSAAARALFPYSVRSGAVLIPYPVEIATAVIVVVIFAIKVLQLAIIWATNTYGLMPDGLYVNQGIINLQNTFVSAIAFTDARLIRTWALRLAGRGLIIVEANDGRRFYLRYIKNPLDAQSIIRRTLSHPTVRTER
jgi:hypothetical protein